jgi:hypothetical protein
LAWSEPDLPAAYIAWYATDLTPWVSSCRSDAAGESQIAVDRSGKHIEVHDRAVRVRSEVDHNRHRWRIHVARDDEFAGNDDRWITRLVEARPDVAGLVLGVEVCRDVDGGRLGPLLQRR